MSLVRIAVRIAAVQALRGATLVGDNVLDSAIGALDIGSDGSVRTDKDKPFIAVYTDAAKSGSGDDIPAAAGVELRSLRMNGATEILFEAGITAAMTDIDPETKESVLVGMGTPDTDAGFEFQLDLIARQIGDALSDPENEWAEIFRRLCPRFIRIERARAGSVEGQRMAAHQVKITAELIPDPVKGEELRPTSAMAAFLTLADTIEDADVQANVATLRSAIAGQAFDWQTIRRRYGLTQVEADALLIATPAGAEPDIDVTDVTSAPAQPVQP